MFIIATAKRLSVIDSQKRALACEALPIIRFKTLIARISSCTSVRRLVNTDAFQRNIIVTVVCNKTLEPVVTFIRKWITKPKMRPAFALVSTVFLANSLCLCSSVSAQETIPKVRNQLRAGSRTKAFLNLDSKQIQLKSLPQLAAPQNPDHKQTTPLKQQPNSISVLNVSQKIPGQNRNQISSIDSTSQPTLQSKSSSKFDNTGMLKSQPSINTISAKKHSADPLPRLAPIFKNLPDTSFAPSAPKRRNFIAGKSNAVTQTQEQESIELNDFLGTKDTPIQQSNPDSLVEGNTWWKSKVVSPLVDNATEQPVDTNSLVYATLQNSPRIRAISQRPLILEQQIVEAEADFDPLTFVRSQFEDRVDPVGDTLSTTIDNSSFLKDHTWTGDFGIRRKLKTGASYELSERLGFQNSNSSFFTPQDQGTATLALNVNQPLMKGRGKYYNESQILIAQATSGAAWDTFTAELQDEIQKTISAYWELYFDRSVYLQKQRNVARGEYVLEILEGRKELDSLPSQITRARSAVKSRQTDLANARRDIRDSQTELRRLTADRNWQAEQTTEMLPTETPNTTGIDIELEQVVFKALENRPEIREAMARAKVKCIDLNISENELLPELSLLLGTYVSALKGDSAIGQAIVDQFGQVTPGYSVGLEFKMPYRNRAAKSRVTQSKLELAKIKAVVDEKILNVVAESQISLRRVTSAKETLDAALQAIVAARADLEQSFRRWDSFALIEGDFADGQTPTTALDQLLDSQERLTNAELVYAEAELELKSSEVQLQRTMGTLLIHENINFNQSNSNGTPELNIQRQEKPQGQPQISPAELKTGKSKPRSRFLPASFGYPNRSGN